MSPIASPAGTETGRSMLCMSHPFADTRPHHFPYKHQLTPLRGQISHINTNSHLFADTRPYHTPCKHVLTHLGGQMSPIASPAGTETGPSMLSIHPLEDARPHDIPYKHQITPLRGRDQDVTQGAHTPCVIWRCREARGCGLRRILT